MCERDSVRVVCCHRTLCLQVAAVLSSPRLGWKITVRLVQLELWRYHPVSRHYTCVHVCACVHTRDRVCMCVRACA